MKFLLLFLVILFTCCDGQGFQDSFEKVHDIIYSGHQIKEFDDSPSCDANGADRVINRVPFSGSPSRVERETDTIYPTFLEMKLQFSYTYKPFTKSLVCCTLCCF